MLLSAYDAWEQLNENLTASLSLPAGDYTTRAYTGLAPAIWEIVQGTAQFYSHKQSMVLITGQSPHLAPVLPYLYKDGFNVQTLSAFENTKEFVEGLKKDTNFVIYCEDHPVTGELYEMDELDLLLNEKKIFSLRVSHQNHLYRNIEIRPYTVRICGYHPQAAIALLGSKFKSPSTVAPLQFWDPENFIAGIQAIQKSSKEDSALVKKFESSLPEGYSALKLNGNRCFDRSLIYSNDIAGEALQTSLASKLKVSLQRPGWERNIETTHLCRWGGVSTYQSWWEKRPSDQILRNMLILSLPILENPNLQQYLREAHGENRFVIEA